MQTRTREIIQQYFDSSHSKRTIKKFAIWFRESFHNSEKEAVITEILNNLDISADESTERSFKVFMSRIKTSLPAPQKQKHSFIYKLSRIVAVVVLPILSIGITYYIMKEKIIVNNEVRLVECIVPDGEIRTIILPDSSVVKVNSGSILIYPQQFKNTRNIYLNGEAYFVVTKDETRPFKVKTTDMDIEVLGTVFNVSAYTDSESSSAMLESGKVNVKFKNKNAVILHPDEQVTYSRVSGSIEKSKVIVENAIAWTEGNMIIQSLSITEVVKIIERKYAVKVYLNSNRYKQERITMKITDGENISEFMNVLQYLVPQLKYKIEADKLYIY